jgi:hypothetical protein
MRYESSVTSLSWIPSEAVTGTTKTAFEGGFAHYDQPPPGQLGPEGSAASVTGLQQADRFRFANVLSAWIETDDHGNITAAGYGGNSGGLMGATTVRFGAARHTFRAVGLADLQREPEYGDGWVRFTQTTGGRTGIPAPRRVAHPPFLQWQAPTVWTTLTLTLHASGQVAFGVPGASRFPRHWVYDASGTLARKSGLTDFGEWFRKSFGKHTPWGDEDSAALVVAVESALERSLSVQLMHGAARPKVSDYPAGATLVRQGSPGSEVYLILDGVIRVERNGQPLAEYGPGAMLGERAQLEEGLRTASLLAVTPCKVASVPGAVLDKTALVELSGQHRREGD